MWPSIDLAVTLPGLRDRKSRTVIALFCTRGSITFLANKLACEGLNESFYASVKVDVFSFPKCQTRASSSSGARN